MIIQNKEVFIPVVIIILFILWINIVNNKSWSSIKTDLYNVKKTSYSENKIIDQNLNCIITFIKSKDELDWVTEYYTQSCTNLK
jgi:hypothetical protein